MVSNCELTLRRPSGERLGNRIRYHGMGHLPSSSQLHGFLTQSATLRVAQHRYVRLAQNRGSVSQLLDEGSLFDGGVWAIADGSRLSEDGYGASQVEDR